MKYWLMKTDPDSFQWNDLKASPHQTTCWDGVRNYQDRNFMRDEMKVGDSILFYHSQITPQIIPGICKVVREAYPDETQFDSRSKYYDSKASKENPRWFMVDIQIQMEFATPVTLEAIKERKTLKNMELLRKGSRLSIQPVKPAEFRLIKKMGEGMK